MKNVTNTCDCEVAVSANAKNVENPPLKTAGPMEDSEDWAREVLEPMEKQ